MDHLQLKASPNFSPARLIHLQKCAHKGAASERLILHRILPVWRYASFSNLRGVRQLTCSVEENQPAAQQDSIPFSSVHGIQPAEMGPPGAHSPGDFVHERYEILGLLGKGGNAVTYKAIDTTSNSNVAIKCLSLRQMKDWKQLDLFEREAKTLQSLNHPGIPKYIEYFESDDDNDRRFYIVQELAIGKTLAQLLREGWRTSEDEVRSIAIRLLEILNYLSSLNPPVVHRDVKPENIVLEDGQSGGQVYLVDFGGVQGLATDTMIGGSTIVGTYGYMAPEQFRGEAQPASDMYGFGATLLFILSGKAPNMFPQERLKIVFEDSTSIRGDFQYLLNGLLEPLPEDRISGSTALQILNNENPSGEGIVTKRQLRGSSRPAGSRVVLKRSSSGLSIDIPPAGVTGETVMTGSFAVAWNSFIVFWTWSALTAGGGLLPLLFSVPFWVAGAQLTSSAVGSSLTREQLQINSSEFTLEKKLAFLSKVGPLFDDENSKSKECTGKSRDLTRAEVITTVIVNGVPQMALEIHEGVRSYIFGEGLKPLELEWLANEINETIQGL